MVKKSSQIINSYISKWLIGVCKNKELLYKNNDKTIDYSVIDIKPLTFILNTGDEKLDLEFENEVGNTIIGGYKLYGQELINEIGVVLIKVYDQNKEFVANVPFGVTVDLKSHSVALKEIMKTE